MVVRLVFGCLVACSGSKSPTMPSNQPPTDLPTEEPDTEESVEPVPSPYEFAELVRGSRGEIMQCLAAAVASDPTLQGRPIELGLSATFEATGSLGKLALDPAISKDFEACVQAIGAGWKVSSRIETTFQASLRLDP